MEPRRSETYNSLKQQQSTTYGEIMYVFNIN